MMRKIFCILGMIQLVFMGAMNTQGAEGDELLRNGDFEKGRSGWKGDGRVSEEEVESGEGKSQNKVMILEVKRREDEEVYQEVRTRKLREIHVKGRYRVSEDYDGLGIMMKFKRPDGSYTYHTYEPTKKARSKGQWQELSWSFKEIRNASELKFYLVSKQGDSGKVYFDNFSVTEVR